MILDMLLPSLRAGRHPSIDAAYFDGWIARVRPSLEAMLVDNLTSYRQGGGKLPPAIVAALDARDSQPSSTPRHGEGDDSADLPEAWTPSKRTRANLVAMQTLAALLTAHRQPDQHEEALLRGYSGWGGLSITGAAEKFPVGLPVPEERGLIHEFYTPTKITREVARIVTPLVPGLPHTDGQIHVLEPSAGIGRFLRGFEGRNANLVWHVCEWSELSATLLHALYPALDVYSGPFERWVRERGDAWHGKIGLVLSNPPYGARGASFAEDPDRSYRDGKTGGMAYHYFLRRGLDLLAPGGLGVYLVPGGFLTSRAPRFVELREKVLKRHHLASAYRLPSMNAQGREAIFPGAMLVTDLLFFRARGGTLDVVDEGDHRIVGGEYFKQYPTHILGREVGDDHGEDDQGKMPRWGYQVQGDFSRLPDLVERPICADCSLTIMSVRGSGAGRVGVTRVSSSDAPDTKDLSRVVAGAILLGSRVDRYLALVAANDAEVSALWPELHEGLTSWATANGNPHANVEVRALAGQGNGHAERFLSAFDRGGALIDGLRHKPPVYEPVYRGDVQDVAAQAEHLYRSARQLTLRELEMYHQGLGGRRSPIEIRQRVLAAGWCLDGPAFDDLVPSAAYLTGDLWPKMDRAMTRVLEDAQAALQVSQLKNAIAPAIYDDIEGVSPRQGWIPLHLVSGWFNATYTGYDDVELVTAKGLVEPKGWHYTDIGKNDRGDFHPELLLIIGWINHDKTLFSPSKKFDDDNEKDIDKIRIKKGLEWEASFKGWISASPDRKLAIEHSYNRKFRGYVQPLFDTEPLHLARWKKGGRVPKPHQVAGAKRVLANRGGLLAFDVGVGKTYTALAVIARARQEGWCRRPVVCVPNSIAWKWMDDFAMVLPDYRVAVIGSKKKILTRGIRKGEDTSDTDTPEERAEKWTRFQAGEYDAVILTYTALGRTRMNEKLVKQYADGCEAIAREVALRRRNAAKRKNLSERDEAILKEGVAAWVAQQMELPEDWRYDPGIAWDDIGVDLLIVDEAQNFKNLYLPEEREGGVPRFMGNPGDGSKRAWQLDFRCAAVRNRNKGTGILLLSATPAKNSPLEFYNLLNYVDPSAWTRLGIRDPEGFIDRYLKIEIKPVLTPTMEIEDRGAVVGFMNLHELRDVIFRYGDFKTAEEVGLVLPEAKVEMVEVDMDAEQDAKYDRYVREIEAALKSDDPSTKSKILGLLARMALVAVHAELDEGYKWATASTRRSAESPKFMALAERILVNRDCGHIVFLENVSAHYWIREVLVAAGIKADRIAILNAEVAKKSADRQRIAIEFNGTEELVKLPDGTEVIAGKAPKYDVVIANQIAYEGIDLQTRTCAIHHIDLPWEPATLQQRNGRGVRQGNVLSAIAINYYFSRRSQDGLRFNLIQGKRGWMTALLKGQDRDTNNPGAQMDLGPEEILLLISRNPEQTRARLEAAKAARLAEAKKRVALEASRLLRSINARYRTAERSKDTTEALRLRGEADARLKHLGSFDVESWPWAEHASVVRDQPVIVVESGGPLWAGLRLGIPSAWNASRVDYMEFGAVEGPTIALRSAGAATWSRVSSTDVRFSAIQPHNLHATFPADEGDGTRHAIEQHCTDKLRFSGDWTALGWHFAPDSWVDAYWTSEGTKILSALSRVSYYNAQAQKIPVLAPNGVLNIVNAATLVSAPSFSVFPPTDSGWRSFLTEAPRSPLSWTQLNEAGQWWWQRRIPRNLLSIGRDDEQADDPDADGSFEGAQQTMFAESAR